MAAPAASSSSAAPVPNKRDPETARQIQAQREHRVTFATREGEKEVPYNTMCRYPKCGAAMVPRRNFSGDPTHLDLVCGWAGFDKDGKPVHPQPPPEEEE